MTDAERDFAQQATEDELVDLVARLVRAAADNRGHTPSRKAAHGVCVHCAAARQGSAFVAMMRESESEEPSVSLLPPGPPPSPVDDAIMAAIDDVAKYGGNPDQVWIDGERVK